MGTTLDPDAYASYGNTRPKQEANRFDSFAPNREQNEVKWFVDGCNYFYAVSKAIENAKETIWILDCKCIAKLFKYEGISFGVVTKNFRVALAGALSPPSSNQK